MSRAAGKISELHLRSWQQQYLSIPASVQEECIDAVIERASREGSGST